jgi:uncharacterized protein YdbL (DUF1318 family)
MKSRAFFLHSFKFQHLAWLLFAITFFALARFAHAAADMEINTPAITALKSSMQARHTQLLPHYNSGAVGLTASGLIEVRDTTAVPLKERGGINSLVASENADRSALYKEIAKANGHPEWEGEVRQTFAGRWIDKAQAGWYYRSGSDWAKK